MIKPGFQMIGSPSHSYAVSRFDIRVATSAGTRETTSSASADAALVSPLGSQTGIAASTDGRSAENSTETATKDGKPLVVTLAQADITQPRRSTAQNVAMNRPGHIVEWGVGRLADPHPANTSSISVGPSGAVGQTISFRDHSAESWGWVDNLLGALFLCTTLTLIVGGMWLSKMRPQYRESAPNSGWK